MGRGDPGRDCVSRLLGDLKLDRALGLLLHDRRPRHDPSALDRIVDPETHQIAAAQLAVDGEVERRKLQGSMIRLPANPDGPDPFQLRWGLRPSSLPQFHGTARRSAFVAVSMNNSVVE
jgi:hypothetical protein